MIARLLIPLIVLSALVLGLAACSDDNGGDGDDPTATAAQDGDQSQPTATAASGDANDGDGDGGGGGGGADPDGAGNGDAGNGGDDDGGDDGDNDDEGDAGSARVTVDGDTTELDVDECIPPEGNNPIVVLATNDEEDAELTLGGIAGAVTVGFERDGENWFVVGAILEVSGSTFSYDGPALKDGADPPDAEIAIEVTC